MNKPEKKLMCLDSGIGSVWYYDANEMDNYIKYLQEQAKLSQSLKDDNLFK